VRPLEGVRIADLTWLLAGAGGPRLLASLGAEVIRIEWRDRLDFLRYMPPFAPLTNEHTEKAGAMELSGLSKDSVKSVNRSGYFNDINAGKKGVSLNMSHPRGRELFKRLVAVSDVVVEAFTAETMRKWGLGYEALKAIKSDIIYIQQPGWGYKGPYVKFASYGPIAQAVSGLTEQSGLPLPCPPAGWGFSYMDWSGAYYCALTMLCAIYYKKRTGKGQYIDCSQVEPGIYMTGTAVLDSIVNGRHSQRSGNRSPYNPAAPHGAYRCQGDNRWLALSVSNDGQWQGLLAALDNPSWGTDPRFATQGARLEHSEELDRLVEAWTVTQEAEAAADTLQRAGVPAGVVQNCLDLHQDPRLEAWGMFQYLEHKEMGPSPYEGHQFHLSKTPGELRWAAPVMGQHNEYVFKDILGLSQAEITRLTDEKVIY